MPGRLVSSMGRSAATFALLCTLACAQNAQMRQSPQKSGSACTVDATTRIAYFSLRASVPEEDWNRALQFLLSPTPTHRDVYRQQLRNPQESPGRRLLAAELLAQEAVTRRQLAEAADYWESLRIPDLDQWAICAASLLRMPREQITLVPLEGDVNSPLAEYDAEPDLSGKRMFYTRIDASAAGPPGEEIWFAELKGGQWVSKPVRELNTRSHESVLASSLDGSSIFLFGNYTGPSRGDIFASELTRNGWSKPLPLPAPLNTEFFESDARPTPDGRAVLFASDRRGSPYPYHARQSEVFAGSTQGNTDLYISFVSKGVYSAPVNLGTDINTPGAERNPFLHADGKTLYFASNGHPGVGNMDIFRTIRLDDTWTKWSPPENLGPEINTAGSDSGFRLTGRGDEGLIASLSFSGARSSDIYRVARLPKRLQPAEEIILLRGEVKDPAGVPVQADVFWRKEGSADPEGQSRSRPDTGEYVVPLARDRRYQIELSKQGFFKHTFPVDTRKSETKERDVPVVLRMDPAHKTARSHFQTQAKESGGPAPVLVYFPQNSLRIKNPAALAPLVAFLKRNPRAGVFVTAHADSSGSTAHNRTLSERRARSVFNYLVSRGIAPSRIGYKGIGEQRPAATNRSGRGRQLNRRAVVKVIMPADKRGNK